MCPNGVAVRPDSPSARLERGHWIKRFGVSYHTLKNRLNRIGAILPFAEIEPRAEPPSATSASALLSRLERGELSVKAVLDVDLSKLDPAMIESMLDELGEVNIDVDSGRAQVRITAE